MRRRWMVLGVAVAVAAGLGAVVVPRLLGPDSDERLATVIEDAHRLRSAILRPYPRVDDLELEQSGTTVTLRKGDRVLHEVELAEGDRVSHWSPPPFRSSGWPFYFCIENDHGEWAVYDSNEGVVRRRDTGTDGACRMPVVPGVNAPLDCPDPTLALVGDRVVARWGLGTYPFSFIRWVEVYDGGQLVARLKPWRGPQTLDRIDGSSPDGYERTFTFIATNGLDEADSTGCEPVEFHVTP